MTLCQQTVQINIYELDYALLKTPVPNPELYTSSTLHRLKHSPEKDSLCWRRSGLILSHALDPMKEEEGSEYLPWNPTLLQLVKDDMDNPISVPVLFCNRFGSTAFKEIITRLLKEAGLQFWTVWLDSRPDSFSKLMNTLLEMFPHCESLSFYSTWDQQRDLKIARAMERLYPHVEYFRELCPYQSCMLAPEEEFNMLRRIVEQNNGYFRTSNQLGISKLNLGLVLRLSVDDRQQLFHLANLQIHFLSQMQTRNPLLILGSLIEVCEPEAEHQMMSRICRVIGDQMEVVAEETGCIEGYIYAVRFSCNRPDLTFTYGPRPIALLIYKDGRGTDYQRKAVQSIANWQPINCPRGQRTFYPTLEHHYRVSIKDGLRE